MNEKELVVNAINALDAHRKEAVITCEETCLCWELAALINYLVGGEVELENQELCPMCGHTDKQGHCPDCTQSLNNKGE